MDNADRIDNYLKEISRKVNTNFSLIDRVCVLVDADQRRWVIEVPEHSDFVVLFAPLFVVPDHKKEFAHEHLLRRNIYGNENRGTWLALHPTTNEVTLVYTQIVEQLTCQLFENILTQFVEFSKEMAELLQNEIMKEEGAPIGPTPMGAVDNTSDNRNSGKHDDGDDILPYQQDDFSRLA